MTKLTTIPDSMQPATEMAVDLFDNWFDPIETEVRARARQFIEELIRGELDTALARPRYERSKMAGNEAGACVTGYRHGSRTRSLTGTFGPIEIAEPRARLTTPEGASRGNPARFFVTAGLGVHRSDSVHSCNKAQVPGV
jgi:putative transposase